MVCWRGARAVGRGSVGSMCEHAASVGLTPAAVHDGRLSGSTARQPLDVKNQR